MTIYFYIFWQLGNTAQLWNKNRLTLIQETTEKYCKAISRMAPNDVLTSKADDSERAEVDRIRQQLMMDLKSILQCSQCCQLAELADTERSSDLKGSDVNRMYSCLNEHLVSVILAYKVRTEY